MSIQQNIQQVKQTISQACEFPPRDPERITIIGVTKYVDAAVAEQLIDNGITHLGENRPDVFLQKYDSIGPGPTWHFIGNLQSRRVKDVIDKIDYFHALDRLSLAQEIQKRANKTVNCFVQVNVSGEETKQGISPNELLEFVQALQPYSKIKVVGLMTMAPNTEDDTIIRHCFNTLQALKSQVQALNLAEAPCTELSMGMTNDYPIAIKEGATFIRLGRCLVN